MYEKTLFFDSHENYRSKGTRDHPVYFMNEEIYGNSLYLKRCSFFNSLKNVSGTFQLNIYVNVSNTTGNVPSDTYTPSIARDIPAIGDLNSTKLRMYMNTADINANNVQFVWNEDFRDTIGNLGLLVNLTSGAPTNKYISIHLFVTPLNENWKPVREFLSFLGKENLVTEQAIVDDYVQFLNITDKELSFTNNNENADFLELYQNNINTELIFDFFQPRYLFLHSNLHSQFICKNQLKIGDRKTFQTNDVIAVIPINALYGARVDWTELQTMGMDKALDINTISDINNAEFWFTTRSVDGREEKVSFEGRTFQLTIQYITSQYR